jgi:hypothetical protein
MPAQSQGAYVPGVCNIGPAEIATRKRSAWGATVVGVAFLAFVLATDASAALRLAVFFPATLAAIGFLQAYYHFCVGFGFGGMYNVLKPAGVTERIDQAEYRAADKAKALKILGYAAVIGIIVAILACLA